MANAPDIDRLGPEADQPHGVETGPPVWGADAIALMLRECGIEYIALNPGASYRGLHDSLVNFLGNERPQMLVCLHEEHTVAIAHGYAKVTGRPIAAIVHSNVGLMHASMAIFNAWCDRAPALVLGATGPLDSTRRRSWIEWIHTARDQGALVRDYTKWDDQPGSARAALESIARAWQITRTPPCGPTYVCLDVAVQDDPIEGEIKLPLIARHDVPLPAQPALEAVRQAAQWLREAKHPVILMGRMSARPEDWINRVGLAERLQAKVITDLKQAAVFPTRHALHAGAPGYRLSADSRELLSKADVVLDLDFVDPAGTILMASGKGGLKGRHIRASMDCYATRGWSMDYCQLPEVDLHFPVQPDSLVAALLSELPETTAASAGRSTWPGILADLRGNQGDIRLEDLAATLKRAIAGRVICLVRLPLRWPGQFCEFEHPLDYLGYDGGGGIGSGPGMAVGAALALRGTDRLPVAVLGDGDTLMGANALWTAARYRIPLLVVVANNRAYQNDVDHQETVAVRRNRPVENKYIGQSIDNPAPDLPALARSLGWTAADEVRDYASLQHALEQGLDVVARGGCHLVSVAIHVPR